MTDAATLNEVYALLQKVAVKVGVEDAPDPVPGAIRFPTGPIKSRLPWGAHPSGIDWNTIARWEPMFSEALTELGNPYGPLLLACFALVETGGQHFTNGKVSGTRAQVVRGNGDNRSIGLLQIRTDLHDPQERYQPFTPQGNIRLGAKLLKDWIASEGSWEAALANKWHPGTDPASGVNQQRYIQAVRDLVAEAKGQAPSTGNPFRKPTIYSLATDYARFGLTRQQANKIIGNRFEDRQGGDPRYIVNHIQDGTTPGSLNWWATGAGVQASSTVMANRDGSILRIIPEEHGPWTNGDTCNPTAKSAGLRALGGNPNNWTLTLEAEGTPGITAVSYTAEQEESICWQCAEWIAGYDLGKAEEVVISHASINFCDRERCPGNANQLRILQRLKDAGF